MASQDLPQNPAFLQAVELLKAGKPAEAEALAIRAADECCEAFGPDSPEHGRSRNDLGRVLLWTGQLPQALAAFRLACAKEYPGNEQATRDRLTYLMNLAMALEQTKALDDAEAVLRQGMAAREAFYGRGHPGYAFGLEPLVKLLLRKGDFTTAVAAADETVANFWRNGHPRVATTLALRAEAMRFNGEAEDPFADTPKLPDDILAQIADAVVARVEETEPAIASQVLQDLVPHLAKRLGETDNRTITALSRIANLESALGDHDTRIGAIRRVAAAYETAGQAVLAAQALQGLGLAQSQAGRFDEAEATYRLALGKADVLGDPAVRSQAKRNFGLYLAERNRRPEGEELLRSSLEDARASGNGEVVARAEIGLGIFLQHGGQMEEARTLLADALTRMDPAHPDAVTARSHLGAVENGGGCGCGDLRQALTQAFRQFVLSQMPAGLIEELKVDLVNDNFNVQVRTNREPTDEEKQLLERVNRHALHQFKTRVTRRS